MTDARITREVLEILRNADPNARVTRENLEVSRNATAKARVTRQSLGELYNVIPKARVSRQAIEVIYKTKTFQMGAGKISSGAFYIDRAYEQDDGVLSTPLLINTFPYHTETDVPASDLLGSHPIYLVVSDIGLDGLKDGQTTIKATIGYLTDYESPTPSDLVTAVETEDYVTDIDISEEISIAEKMHIGNQVEVFNGSSFHADWDGDSSYNAIAGGILLSFKDGNYSNNDNNRYAYNPLNNTLHGPFDSNELAYFIYENKYFASFFESVTETTGYTETIAGNWSTVGVGLTLTADQIEAPDSNKLADKIHFPGGISSRIYIALGSATDDTDQTLTVWVKTTSGTKDFRLGFTRKNGAAANSGNLTATTQWQRFDYTEDILSGATTPEARIVNDSGNTEGDIYVWGAAVYKDRSFPHSYRTNDTGSDQVQAKDQFYWDDTDVPAAIYSGEWAHDWMPFWGYDDVADHYFARTTGANDYVHYKNSADDVRVVDNGIVVVDSAPLTFSCQLITNEYNAATGYLKVSGATSGNGEWTNIPWSWATGEDLYYGMTAGATFQINGNISEPRKP